MRTIIVAMGMKVRMAMVFIVCMYVRMYIVSSKWICQMEHGDSTLDEHFY